MPTNLRMLLCAGAAGVAVMCSSSGKVRTQDDLTLSSPVSPVSKRGASPLSVMTYNVAGLPWPLAMGRDAALGRIADRLADMRKSGRQPHLVLLQEAFTPEAAQIAARAGYRHVAFGADTALRSKTAPSPADVRFLRTARWDRGEQWGKPLGSGLIILSDYPIVGVHRMAFPDFACAGFDCLANKGVLLARVQVPGFTEPVTVANAHLNARKASGVPIDRAQQAYRRQVALMAGFIKRHAPHDAPLLFGGDMNIGKDPDRARIFFDGFAQSGLGFITPRLGGLRRALAQAAWSDERTRSDLTSADRHGKDWVFARMASGSPLPITRARVPFGSERDGEPLSDHFGYVIDYASPRQRIGEALVAVDRPAGPTG